MAQQESNRRGKGLPALNAEQKRWLEMIRDHIAANLSIDSDDFDYAPFAQQGGLGKFCQVFGCDVGAYGDTPLLKEMNEALAA